MTAERDQNKRNETSVGLNRRRAGMEMQKIFETIRQYHMIEPGMHVIAGISGGADSVCLLLTLHEYRNEVPFALTAVHVEHGIRGKESLSDAAFTQELCRRFGIPCRVCHVDVPQIARETGQTLEEAARMQRYRLFEEVRTELDADRIAVAHNENDQAETLLWNLVRGSGLKGLGGIRPVRDQLIRPLLFTSRQRIEELVRDAGLAWCTDRTNLETEYTRNRIRHEILPVLADKLNAKAVSHMAQAAQHMQEVQSFVARMTQQAAGRVLKKERDDVLILLEAYYIEERLIQTELLRTALTWCRDGSGLKDIASVHIAMLENLAQMDCGKECHLPGGIRAVRENGVIRLIRMQTEGRKNGNGNNNSNSRELCSREAERCFAETVLQIPGIQQIGTVTVETELFQNAPELLLQIQEEKKYTKWLSCDTIECNVCLRTRRSGDYIVVNEEGGRKKLKDFFIDRKIPKDQRDRVLLAADGSHILWVIGYRISEAARVRDNTKQVMKLQIREENI